MGRSVEDWLEETKDPQLATYKALRKTDDDAFKATLLLFAEDKSLLQCSRCKEWKVTFFQRQTRGGDEAMTVFCECKGCGKKWKQ